MTSRRTRIYFCRMFSAMIGIHRTSRRMNSPTEIQRFSVYIKLKGRKYFSANRRNVLQKIIAMSLAVLVPYSSHYTYCMPAVLSYHLKASKSPFSYEMLSSVLMVAKHSTPRAISFTKAESQVTFASVYEMITI